MQFFSWRSAVTDSDLSLTTKAILLVISTYMDDHGEGAFPSMETIARKASASKRSVVTHVRIAQEAGFLKVSRHGFSGQRWARNEYRIAFPDTKAASQAGREQRDAVRRAGKKGGETPAFHSAKAVNAVPEAGASGVLKPVQALHSISPVNSPNNSSENSPLTPRGGNPAPVRKAPTGIAAFLDACRSRAEKPVPEDDPVFEYAEKSGIPYEFLRLAWREFVDRNRDSDKRYRDWRKAFRNCVRGNWYRLWWVTADGSFELTTTGVQAKRQHPDAAA